MRSISALVINVDSKLVPSDFSMDWFLANGFADEEVSAIAGKAQELLKACNSPFSCIIWSTALSLQDEIIRDLKRYGSVESIKDTATDPLKSLQTWSGQFIKLIRLRPLPTKSSIA